MKLGLGKQMTFARDRLLESFLWGIGVTPEPEFGRSREEIAKAIQLITILDDVYDLYGTVEELELFTDAVDRWDVRAMEKLPEYMKICYLALFNTVNELAYDTLKEKGCDITPCLRKLWGDFSKAALVEAKWYSNGYTPTLDEYLNNAWISITGTIVLATAFFAANMKITKEALECINNYPNLLYCSSMILRLCDDLGTSTAEIERGDVPKSIQCYMHETGALESDSRKHIRGLISDTWKKMNKESVSCSPLPELLINAALDLGRISLCFYQYGDGFGDPNMETKERIMSLLVEPILVKE
ncbi:alpha-terpineol synthase, chloroplastic-like [Tasmannia lanceolata]|uniref:alpha-terpineol synthase, chloroplastic-like n=1 Tax=Tasmannia lanceolata TaxID=3420 RepID=UPI004064581E